ncbi:hypothetical protein [Pelagibius sp.]|uniref:hypothetical protein n=1 Tax=Pelagibius sp. TaxID=1931238 RepID=UPI00262422B7|nr:hypothetical protein [Pelagibius sp.]
MTKWRKLVTVVIVCGLWSAITMGYLAAASASGELPVRAVKITMAHEEHGQFVDQISELAAENTFEVRVGQPLLDPTDIRIWMWRRDLKMLAVPINDPNTLDLRYDIGIYASGDQPLPMDLVDRFVEDLQDRLRHLDRVTFTIFK